MGLSHERVRHRCDRIQECISLELDGELSRLEQARVDRHLAGCPECAAFRAEAHAFTGALRSAPLERLEHPIALPVGRRVSFRSFQVAAAAALAVAAVGLATLSTTLRDQQIGTGLAVPAGLQVDGGTDQLRARQLQVLTERIAQTQPRPVGSQPV